MVSHCWYINCFFGNNSKCTPASAKKRYASSSVPPEEEALLLLASFFAIGLSRIGEAFFLFWGVRKHAYRRLPFGTERNPSLLMKRGRHENQNKNRYSSYSRGRPFHGDDWSRICFSALQRLERNKTDREISSSCAH